MKIAVLTALWGRPEITKVFAAGIEALKPHFDLTVYAAASETDDAILGASLGFKTIWADNNPLGEKWNEVYRFAKVDNPDAYLIMGSDDVISREGLQALVDSKQPHCGFDSIIFYDSLTKECGVFTYTLARIIGAGRFILRHAAERCDELCKIQVNDTVDNEYVTMKQATKITMHVRAAEFFVKNKKGRILDRSPVRLWTQNLNMGLDNSLEQRLSYFGYPPVCLPSNNYLLDVKSAVNMWKMESWLDKIKPFDADRLSDHFDESVIRQIGLL